MTARHEAQHARVRTRMSHLMPYDLSAKAVSTAATAVLSVMSLSPRAPAQCLPTQVATLSPPSDAEEARFGTAVAISGDVLVVGAPQSYWTGAHGSAHVYRRAGSLWNLESDLLSLPGDSDGLFGRCVAVEGDRIAIGVPGGQSFVPPFHRGSVQFFEQAGGMWTRGARLESETVLSNFGCAIALRGDTLLIGEPDGLDGIHAVHVYRRQPTNAWVLEQSIVSPAPEYHDRFGESISFDGARLLVGAPQLPGSPPENQSGAAFIFVRDGEEWHCEGRLDGAPTFPPVQPPAWGYANFGGAVAIDGDRAMVLQTARIGTDQCSSMSEVFVFERMSNGWKLTDRVSGLAGIPYGESTTTPRLALRGGIAVLGVPYDIAEGQGGAAVVLHRESDGRWSAAQRFRPDEYPPKDPQTSFGAAVAMDGQTIAIGAPFEAVGTSDSAGVARVFQLPDGEDPVFAQDLADTAAYESDKVVLTVEALSSEPLHFEWAYNGEKIHDSFPFGGTATSSLTIQRALVGMDGTLQARAFDGCGRSTSSRVAQFTVTPVCPTDINNDGVTGLADIAAILFNWGAPCK
ncbi:MAG TPA: hypothetical protein VG797_02150 [Phycisphaerales bacterium]|nr:hypothetical protein [Phycisphaerales bacterium]